MNKVGIDELYITMSPVHGYFLMFHGMLLLQKKKKKNTPKSALFFAATMTCSSFQIVEILI